MRSELFGQRLWHGSAVSAAFEQELRTQIDANSKDALTVNLEPDTGAGVRSGFGAATVLGSYVARAVVQRLGTQLSRRVAGNIAARVLGRAGSAVIPVVGWAIGGGLIVWDVVNGVVNGPFPAIARQLSGEEIQKQIQQEIATSLREDTPTVSSELSAGIANEIFTQWQSFTQNFEPVLNLAKRNATFRQDLERVPEINLYKLAEIVQNIPEKAVLEATQKGELRRVVELPESALEILETKPSITTVLAWADIAGTRLDEVISTEVYRYKAPKDFSGRTLTRLLDTDNVVTIAKVSALPKEDMNTLLALPTANLNALTNEFNPGQLQTVSWYASALNQEPFNALVTRLIERPSRLSDFEPEAVRTAVAVSRNPASAIALLANKQSFGPDTFIAVYRDLDTVLSRAVEFRLFVAKYNLVTLFFLLVLLPLIAVLFVAGLVTRLLRPFRHRRS